MKKKLVFAAIGLISLAVSKQCQSQSWSLTGNSGTNVATNFVGTTDNVALKFRTNNLTRMTISSGGSVGIGTGSPSNKLSVSGSANFTGNVGIGTSAPGYKLQVIGTGRFEDGVKMGGFGIVELDAPGIVAGRLKIDSAGNVGIGITKPVYKLDISNDARINGVVVGRGYGNINTNTAVGDGALNVNTTGHDNTAVGSYTLDFNSTGSYNTAIGIFSSYSNNSGNRNTSAGYKALYSNNGDFNTAHGCQAMNFNTTGSNNVANGYQALDSNQTGGKNTAVGVQTLFNNISGNENVAVGYNSLYKGSGDNNTATGSYALENNTGSYNTATGKDALRLNTSSTGCTANGYQALYNNLTGINNTGIGTYADVTTSSFTNATALGYQALATASNSIMLGNTFVTSVKAAGSFVILSDGRFKKNIKENVPGLDFINQLKPVTYNYDIHGLNNFIGLKSDELNKDINEKAIVDKEKMVYSGFIAQDVEKIAQNSGYNFSGVYKPQNANDPYGISYADFVMPLVKAVQELSKQNNDLRKVNADVFSRLDMIEKSLSQCCSNFIPSTEKQASLASTDAARLEQNQPNPFNQSSVIKFYVPSTFRSAQLQITDLSGSPLKSFNINQSGNGQVTISANEFTAGSYLYSLILDGVKSDSKKMELTK